MKLTVLTVLLLAATMAGAQTNKQQPCVPCPAHNYWCKQATLPPMPKHIHHVQRTPSQHRNKEYQAPKLVPSTINLRVNITRSKSVDQAKARLLEAKAATEEALLGGRKQNLEKQNELLEAKANLANAQTDLVGAETQTENTLRPLKARLMNAQIGLTNSESVSTRHRNAWTFVDTLVGAGGRVGAGYFERTNVSMVSNNTAKASGNTVGPITNTATAKQSQAQSEQQQQSQKNNQNASASAAADAAAKSGDH